MTTNEFVKNTPDYKYLLQVLQLLRSQKERTSKEIEFLKAQKQNALGDPRKFVENLSTKQHAIFPSLQWIARVPQIDFQKYSSVPTAPNRNMLVTPAQLGQTPIIIKDVNEKTVPDNQHQTPHKYAALNSTESKIQDNNTSLSNNTAVPVPGMSVRGRIYTDDKPVSFNRLWTKEEHEKLEKLLEIYPDEPVAAHRWAKIAAALGDRTPKQVASRTQKYFTKLAKDGKPVPGKVPNIDVRLFGFLLTSQGDSKKRKNINPKQEIAQILTPSMSSDEEDDNQAGVRNELTGELLDLDEDLRSTGEYIELLNLMKLQKKMRLDVEDNSNLEKQQVCSSCGFHAAKLLDESSMQQRLMKCLDCSTMGNHFLLCTICISKWDSSNHATHKVDHSWKEISESNYFLDEYKESDS